MTSKSIKTTVISVPTPVNTTQQNVTTEPKTIYIQQTGSYPIITVIVLCAIIITLIVFLPVMSIFIYKRYCMKNEEVEIMN